MKSNPYLPTPRDTSSKVLCVEGDGGVVRMETMKCMGTPGILKLEFEIPQMQCRRCLHYESKTVSPTTQIKITFFFTCGTQV